MQPVKVMSLINLVIITTVLNGSDNNVSFETRDLLLNLIMKGAGDLHLFGHTLLTLLIKM